MNYPALFLSTDSIQNVFSSSSKKVQSLPPLQSQYECEVCDYKTAKKELMRQHKLVKHSRNVNKCSACSYTHYFKGKVRQHFNQVHLNIKRKCTTSRRKSCYIMDCKNAEKELCEEMSHNRIDCEQCDYYSLSKISMKRHIKVKHEGLVFNCHQCDFVSTRKETLRSHTSFAHDGEVFRCEQCGHFSSSNKALKLHLKIHNRKQHNIKEEITQKANPNPGDSETAFRCFDENCKDSSRENCVKMGHHRLHCQECGFFAYFKRALKDHKRKHKTHSCSQCNYYVKSQSSLKRHIETRHTRLKSLEGLESLHILDETGQQSGNESKENFDKCKEEEGIFVTFGELQNIQEAYEKGDKLLSQMVLKQE